MREAIGGTWIFGLVIVFIVLFTSYLALSVNYSKAFKVKNKIITLIEENEGLTDKAQEDIVSYLNNVGYFVYGPCGRDSELEEEGYSAPTGYEGQGLTNRKYKYCVATRESNSDTLDRKYYKVTVFFKFDIPILDNIFTFPVTGETKAVYFPKD